MKAGTARAARRALLWLPVAAMVAVAVAVNLWALRNPLRLDLTSAGVYSIGPESRRVIAATARPVRITFFYDIRNTAHADAKALLDRYAAASDAITVRTYDPMLSPSVARRYRVSFPGTAVFESGDRRVVVNGGSEAAFTNGLIRATKNVAQRICFTDGHLESDPFSLKTHDHFEGGMSQPHRHSTGGRVLEIHERHGMGMAKDALETLGYAVAKVLLLKGPGQLAGCSLVVAASPQRPFLPRETAQLRAYLADGGRAVLLLEPFGDAALEPVLADFGIRYERGLVHDAASHYWTDPTTPAVSAYPRHKVTRNLALTFFPGTGSLAPVPGGLPGAVTVTPLIETSADAVLRPTGGAGPDDGDRAMRRTLMVEAVRRLPADDGAGAPEKREARLVVVADGDFATNSFYHILGNGALFLNAVNALAGEEDLIDITPRTYEVPRLRLSNRQMRFTFLFSAVLMPGLLLAVGATVWWRRR